MIAFMFFFFSIFKVITNISYMIRIKVHHTVSNLIVWDIL